MASEQRFVHLHAHTDASLRDGLGTVDRLLDHAKAIGFSTAAITDHGTLANAVGFTIAAKARGIKPIIGLEGYVEYDGEIGHITLLADGNKGWHSLVELNNAAQRGPYKSPAFTIDQLTTYSDNLICLTGCIASPLHQLGIGDAVNLAYRLKSAFGSRLFAELMFNGDYLTWERPLKLASLVGIKPVVTNDVHFPKREDANIHSILTKMKSGFSYDSSQLYLKTRNQMVEAMHHYDIVGEQIAEWLDRAYNIGNKLKVVELEAEPSLPKIHHAGGLKSLIDLAKPLGKPYVERFKHEFGIIKEMGYEDYFLILEDLISFAHDTGIRVGPGRGSGAGSLILYLMGITTIDPIKHGLQFERFLNPERRGMPDVDVDIDSDRRDEVLEYASKKYGAVPIATYARYSHKSLVRDLGKMFGLSQEAINRLADTDDKSEEFSAVVDEHPSFGQAYEAFMGQIRHKGKHAGGIIITNREVPLERVSGKVVAGWTEGKDAELSYAGVVKYDILGVSALSAIDRLAKITGSEPPQTPPNDGDEVFKIFQSGDLAGIFQFSGSDGIRKLTMDVKPNSFEDLIAINALYRPGAIDAGSMERYVEWRHAPRDVPKPFADVLKPTYGAIIYQEQFMEIYRRAVNGTLGQADTARRIIAKGQRKTDDAEWRKKFMELRIKFLRGCGDNLGLSEMDSINWWSEMATHVGYSFNKSHSAAYSMIAWQTAWYKYYFQVDFYATMLNVDKENEQTYVLDAVSDGIEIRPPHVNMSRDVWVGHEPSKTIYMPLNSIKYMGAAGALTIMEERDFGMFSSVEDFMERVPKRLVRARAREGLFMLGGFEGFPETDAVKTLGLKELPVGLTNMEIQNKYLGFIIPNRRVLSWFETHEKRGLTCGVVANIDHRTSRYGPYAVFRLHPRGIFWSRDADSIKVGATVAVKISDKNGKAEEIVELR